MACIHAYTETCEQMDVIFYLLRQTEMYIDDLMDDGQTVLHCVSRRGNFKLVTHFVDVLGADCTIEDNVRRFFFLSCLFPSPHLTITSYLLRWDAPLCTLQLYTVADWMSFVT
jgi:hypothetical protein